MLNTTFFAQESVKRIYFDDFLPNPDLIRIKYDNCMLIFFYANNTESINVGKIWAEAASQTAGAVFAACNLSVEVKVAELFTRVGMESDNIFNWAGMFQIPFILVYRGGIPRAFYNGSRAVNALIDYSLTLACSAGYGVTYGLEDKSSKFGGMQSENIMETHMPTEYKDHRTRSDQYLARTSIRQYDPTLPNVAVASDQEAAEGKQLNDERAAAAGKPVPKQTQPSSLPPPQTTSPVNPPVQAGSPVTPPAPVVSPNPPTGMPVKQK